MINFLRRIFNIHSLSKEPICENVNMTVSDLKRIIRKLPDDMPIIVPVISEYDCNNIFGFRHVRTAGILFDEYDDDPRVLCLNASAYGVDISYQVKEKDIVCEKVLF